jgi:hypothetical protein
MEIARVQVVAEGPPAILEWAVRVVPATGAALRLGAPPGNFLGQVWVYALSALGSAVPEE